MNLWILSQNKDSLEKAEKVKVVYMDDYDEYGEPVMVRLEDRVFENHKKTYGIVVNDAYVFGEYKTRKRALEVLAEINSIKWWKYMADLNFELFIRIIEKNHSEDEKNEIFKLMNTYEMPSE